MALISCGECKKQVSDKADSCPGCGAPIAKAAETRATGGSVQTVQETSKEFKGQIVVAFVIIMIGLGVLFVGGTGRPLTVPAVILSVGVVWYFVARIAIWWHHG